MQSTTDDFLLNDKFKLRLTMLSDWHIGSGAGRPGNVDRLVLRDADGYPFAPAKTITGIWRDAAEQLADGLDEGKKGKWTKLVEIVFGNQPALDGANPERIPNKAILSIGPARYSKSLRDRIKQRVKNFSTEEEGRRRCKQQLQAAFIFIKPGVAIDPLSGQARPDFLRFEEMCRAGAVLEADCTLDLEKIRDEEEKRDIAALLSAAAKLVERIGGKRRRGAGRCNLEIVADETSAYAFQNTLARLRRDDERLGESLEQSLDSLSLENNKSRETPPQNEGDDESSDDDAKDTDQWLRVPLKLTLQTPLAIAARTLGNVSETLDYLPGTYLLPHITRCLDGYNCHADVARGDLQVLPATIDVEGRRGLPVPMAIFKKKGEKEFERSGTVFNRLCEKEPDDRAQIKGRREGYIAFDDGGYFLPHYQTVPKTLGTHNVVEDRYQRPTENVGGVYSREAIASDVCLRTELRLRSSIAVKLAEKDPKWYLRLNSEGCRLGSSNKDDYGAVKLEVAGEPEPHISEAGLSSEKPDLLTVWLLSDVLLRGRSLRPTTSVEDLCCALASELGVTLRLNEKRCGEKSEEEKPDDDLLSDIIRARRIESWQVSWNKPRPSLLALSAGSCAVFKVEGQLDEAAMRRVEATGIGERRGEGYGQISFNAPLLTQKINQWGPPLKDENDKSGDESEKDTGPDEPIKLSEEEEQTARQIERALWSEELRRRILSVAADTKARKEILGVSITPAKESKPSLSQLGALRSALAGLQSVADRQPVFDWLKHLKATPNRKEAWAGALDKIEKLISDESYIWRAIEWEDPIALTDGASERLRNELWGEGVRGLVDACLRAHKRETEK